MWKVVKKSPTNDIINKWVFKKSIYFFLNIPIWTSIEIIEY